LGYTLKYIEPGRQWLGELVPAFQNSNSSYR
jgi:hypothetical protein